MRISIRNAAGSPTDVIEKNVVAGRTMVRLAHGQRLEVVDEATGRVPADLQARRGGADGQDLILQSNGEVIEIEGFFAMPAQGEDAVSVSFPGGAVAQITPATAELSSTEWASGSAFAMPEGDAASTMAQSGSAAGSGASSASAVAGGSGGAAAGAMSSAGWWALGGAVLAGGVAVAADDDDNGDDGDDGSDAGPAPTPTFELTAGAASVDEGGDVTFTLTTTNVEPGTQYSYEISGVSASDIEGGKLTGTVTIDADGRALIPVSLLEDLKTEGVETLTITVAGQSFEVSVNDISTTPEPTFALSASAESVDEGADVVFTLITTNVAAGTQYEYEISGINAADVAGGQLTGTVTVDANGRASIPVSLLEDLKTEGVETLTVTVAGQSFEVSVNDISTTPAFVLTPNLDDLTGAATDDVVYGNSNTYNPGDRIDAGEGHDRLSLVLDSTALTTGVEVSNVEQVELQAVGGGHVDMNGYDGSVEQIDIAGSSGSLGIVNQQSLADVSITDSADLTSLDLDYDGQVVAGEADTLNLTVEEVGGLGEDATEVGVDEGIETLNLQVDGAKDEGSGLLIDATGVTNLTVSGGVEGQALHLIDLRVNGDDGAHADHQDGATLDASGFAGDLSVTGLQGGSATFYYAIDIDRGMQVGQSARLVIDGRELTVTLDSIELDGDDDYEAHFTVNGATELVLDLEYYDGAGTIAPADVAAGVAQLLGEEYSVNLGSVSDDHGPRGIFITVPDAPLSISAELAGEPVTVREDVSVEHSEISTLTLGAGDDHVAIGDVHGSSLTYFDRYDLGDGNNILAVDGDVFGTVIVGDGASIVDVAGDIGGLADIHFGVGESSLTVGVDGGEEVGNIGGDATITFDGGSNMVFANGNLSGRASVAFNGDGANVFDALGSIEGSAELTFTGNGENVVAIDDEIAGEAAVSFGDGDNLMAVGNDGEGGIGGSATVTFGDGDNFLSVRGHSEMLGGEETVVAISNGASVEFGDGDNQMIATGDVRGEDTSITFGGGDNMALVTGDVHNATMEFGAGDNELKVFGDLSASVTFGDGDNTVDIGGDVTLSELTLGAGADTVTFHEDVRGSTVNLGGGDNALSIDGRVRSGSEITFGSGADSLALGNGLSGEHDGHSSAVWMGGAGEATVIDMGAGEDTATIEIGNQESDAAKNLVRSGAYLRGGEGDDTLIIRAVDDVNQVVARSDEQLVSVTFDGHYAAGEVVSVTIGGATYEYTVQASDVVLGDAMATGGNIVAGLVGVLGESATALEVLPDEGQPNELWLGGEVGAADIDVSAVGGNVQIEQIADTGISGFETLNLVAANAIDGGDEQNDDDDESGDISVNFELISDVQEVNLVSEVALGEKVHDAEFNGSYVTHEERDAVTFTLENLTADLSDAITISGNEVTATGNRQVERIYVDGDAKLQEGDKIAVMIDGEEYSITVTADDLNGGEDGAQDARNVLNRLAAEIEGESGFEVAVDSGEDGAALTLIGSDREAEFEFWTTRGEDTEFHIEGVDHEGEQDAEAVDDEDADIYVKAHLSEAADTDNDTLTLKLDGEGDFDIAIDAEEPDPRPTYEHLVLDVQDEYSHAIDTSSDDDHREFAGGSLKLIGGVAGASIVIDDVMAKTVTSSSEANVGVRFNDEADADGDYAFAVTTLGGDDVVDISGVTLTNLASIDLGEGIDRLVIGNSWQDADEATGSSSDLNRDRMFLGVSGVEELEVHVEGNDAEGASGELVIDEEVVLDDNAYDAGIERLFVDDGSTVAFRIGDGFDRALSGEIEDDVETTFDIDNDHDVTLVADDELDAEFRLQAGSSGDLTLTAGYDADVRVLGEGSGAITVSAEEDAYVEIQQFGEGDVTVSADGDSLIAVEASGKGAVAVTTGGESIVYVETHGEGEGDVSVTQTDSDYNAIILAGIDAVQNVSVDITAFGDGEATLIKTFGEAEGWDTEDKEWYDYEGEEGEFNTHLEVSGEGGIDTLTLHSWTDEDGEISASSAVGVVVDDAWAVGGAGAGEGADFTLDASAVVVKALGEGESGGVGGENGGVVFVNATQEDDATLQLIGSKTGSNILLGGQLADTLIGGEASDILYGGGYWTPSVRAYIAGEAEFDLGEGVSLSIDLDGAGGEDPITLTFSAGGGEVDLGTFEDAISDFIAGEATVTGAAGTYVYSDGEGATVDIALDGATRESLEELFGEADVGLTLDADSQGRYIEFSSESNYQFDVTSTSDNVTIVQAPINGAADVLDGGAGDDIYAIAFSQLEADEMTTIKGLDLGGNGEASAADRISLGSFLIPGDFGFGSEGSGFGVGEDLQIDAVVNHGEAIEITGPTLEAAVATLFEANGTFASNGEESTNSAGLFSYGEDTYLIATGADDSSGGFGADDFIVKVTGVTGTLDLSDFYHPIV